MAYQVKEIFYTLQGEGAQAGHAAVFCRFAGCNLWSGRQAHRSTAVCQFCDTDFVGTDGPAGGTYRCAESLANRVLSAWDAPPSNRLVVLTGGEPALQVDEALLLALKARGFRVAIETNGTIPLPPGIDWICVSPKAGTVLAVTRGDELKLVFPQHGLAPTQYAPLEFRHFFLQPMDGPELERNTLCAIRYCLDDPRWRLGLQLHKVAGLP